METVKEQPLEWARKHLEKHSHSSFFPRIFEYPAIFHNWPKVKEYILSLNLSSYVPATSTTHLAYKYNRTYRAVHQLEPIDTIIYTALVREVCEVIENYRRPILENSVFSYRIKPDPEGNFFPDSNGWESYISRLEELSAEYDSGYVLVCDIADFYNQINVHRIQSLIVEAGKGAFNNQANIIHEFILNLNYRGSRGIPIGPQASIILAELVMAGIDNHIKTHTDDFARYVDDIRIFFNTYEEAVIALHNLTDCLNSEHHLVLSGEKTKILTMDRFHEFSFKDAQQEENKSILARANERAGKKVDELFEDLPSYTEDIDWQEEYDKAFREIIKDEHFQLLSATYADLFSKSLVTSTDLSLLRYILIRARGYRIRSILPLVLDNFERLLPLIREVIIYLYAVINDDVVVRYKTQFENILSSYYTNLPFINLWIARLLSHKCFNKIDLPKNYNSFLDIRSKSIIAQRRQDTTWVRSFRGKLTNLGPADKRGIMQSLNILPLQEMQPWISSIASSGDIVDQSIASYLISQKKTEESY